MNLLKYILCDGVEVQFYRGMVSMVNMGDSKSPDLGSNPSAPAINRPAYPSGSRGLSAKQVYVVGSNPTAGSKIWKNG